MPFNLFSAKMQKLIKEKGFIEPTLPQKMGIPEILKGSDVLIISPTGMGKTETVFLPLLDMISQKELPPVAALYITPLRSLNRDLLDRLFSWGDKLDVEIAVRHGDTPARERTSQRDMPPKILITTPESLQAVLTGKKFREHMKNVRYVVIDEIHELVGSKRGIQLALGLERLRELSSGFQRIGLSATIGSPELVAEFIGPKTIIIRADADKQYDISVEFANPKKEDMELSEELAIGPETTARLRRLRELITSHKSVIIFTNTRETAEVLSSRLATLDKELKHAVHHGSLSKESRIKSEIAFKKEELKSLIATSSLELGIDIGAVDLVVQYMSPRQVARLIQRVGRSGHNINRISKGIIMSGDEDLFESAIVGKFAAEKRLEGIKLHEMALDVLGNQIIGMTMDEYETPLSKMYSLVKRSYPYRNLTEREFTEVVRFMESLRMIWINETPADLVIKRRMKAWNYYFTNLSTIPDTRQYRVVSIIGNEPIGSLDEEFVAEHGLPGEKFICSGRAWKVVQVEKDRVVVEPIQDIESAIPAWEGELIPVPFEVAQDVGRLRSFVKSHDENEIMKKCRTDYEAAKKMKEIISRQDFVPDHENFLIESYKDFVIIHSASGSLINDTIGRYLAATISRETGISVNIKTDPYRIMLQAAWTKEKVKQLLEKAVEIEPVLRSELERSSMFKWRFLHVAKRFGAVTKRADFQRIHLNKLIAAYAESPIYKEAMNELFLEKMDIAGAERQILAIQEGRIKLVLREGLSHLGELGLVHQFSEIMKPALPAEEIEKIFKRRLLGTRVRLLCMNCYDYSIETSVRDVEKQPECPKCGAHLIAVTHKNNTDAQALIKKKKTRKEMTEEEMKEFARLRRTADLVIVYGKKAVEAMAGRGVGPETAARILARLHVKRSGLYKDVLEAEKTFVRTSKYWR
ncbi:MAG: DEAD/DEAH box helicase [Candidatus Aenigmarchaeota archaeon]|nr:DEAD/DEAH box helicase [Candidatus Aenigmarchaeota archaeon]